MNPHIGYHVLGWGYDLPHAVYRIAKLGWRGVELYDVAGFLETEVQIEALKSAFQETGLQMSGADFGGSFVEQTRLKDEIGAFRRNVHLIKELGGDYIVTGGGRIRTGQERSDRRILFKNLRQLVKIAADSDVEMLFHPIRGTLIFEPEEIKELAETVDLRFAFDTAHLKLGNGDPVRILQQYSERIGVVHLKDLQIDTFVVLGEGQLDFHGICRVLDEQNFHGWLVVELDETSDAERSAQINMNYLRGELKLFDSCN